MRCAVRARRTPCFGMFRKVMDPCSHTILYVVVGKNAKIGANAVVTKDVPENAVMIGIPAKNINTKSDSDKSFKPYGIDHEKIKD